MENKTAQIRLPFWETVRRSFMYVLTNLDVYLKVTALWFAIILYEMFTDFPSICNLSAEGCTGGWMQNVSILLLMLASIAIVIAFCRVIVLKVPSSYFSWAFGKREIVYLLYNILLIAIITLPSIVLIFSWAYFGRMLGMSEGFYNVSLIIPLLLAIYFSRLFLVFPAIAVDDRKMTLKASFKLAEGNANKIFWGQILMTLPVVLLMALLSIIFKLIGSDGYVVRFVFVLLVFALSFLDSCFKASFFAHIYQYFTFYRDKAEENKE